MCSCVGQYLYSITSSTSLGKYLNINIYVRFISSPKAKLSYTYEFDKNGYEPNNVVLVYAIIIWLVVWNTNKSVTSKIWSFHKRWLKHFQTFHAPVKEHSHICCHTLYSIIEIVILLQDWQTYLCKISITFGCPKSWLEWFRMICCVIHHGILYYMLC